MPRKALVIGWDGARADVVQYLLDRGYLPHAARMARPGYMARCAEADATTCAVAYPPHRTAPGFATLLTGLLPEAHGVRDNAPASIRAFWHLAHPTILEHAVAHGRTAAAAGRPYTLGDGQGPGLLDAHAARLAWTVRTTSQDPHADAHLAQALVARLDTADLIWTVWDAADRAGHAHGFGFNRHYMQACLALDGLLGQVWNALQQRPDRADWLVLVTSDHGGDGREHGPARASGRAVPWLMSQPARADAAARPTHLDLFPTVAAWMGLPPRAGLGGRAWVPQAPLAFLA